MLRGPEHDTSADRNKIARAGYETLSSLPIEDLASNGEAMRGKVLRIVLSLISTGDMASLAADALGGSGGGGTGLMGAAFAEGGMSGTGGSGGEEAGRSVNQMVWDWWNMVSLDCFSERVSVPLPSSYGPSAPGVGRLRCQAHGRPPRAIRVLAPFRHTGRIRGRHACTCAGRRPQLLGVPALRHAGPIRSARRHERTRMAELMNVQYSRVQYVQVIPPAVTSSAPSPSVA